MKTCPDTTRSTTLLPATGGRAPFASSHASPIASLSISAWSGFETAGQLSTASLAPSASGSSAGGWSTKPPPEICPSANSVSGALAPSRSATFSAPPAGGSAKELCVGQQLTSSFVKPIAAPSGVTVKGVVTLDPVRPSGTNW